MKESLFAVVCLWSFAAVRGVWFQKVFVLLHMQWVLVQILVRDRLAGLTFLWFGALNENVRLVHQIYPQLVPSP